MTSYGPRSILQGIERGNTDAVRRIMSALMMRLAGTADDVAVRVSCLTADEKAIYTRVINNATGTEDTLLMNMIRRFASALYADDATILKAADDFDNFAVPVVQDSAMGNTEQLESARRKFRQLVQTGELVYHQVKAREQRKEPKTSGEGEQAEDQKVIYEIIGKAGKKAKQSGKLVFDNGHRQNGDNGAEKAAAAEPLRKIKDQKWPGPLYKRNPKKGKHAPIKPYGHKCIDDGTHDREPARVGHRDDSKLSMVFRLRKKNKKGRWIPGGRALFQYERIVDWNDKKSVTALNGWRQGNFVRQIGRKNEDWGRETWLESERDRLIKVLSNHLATRDGRWRQILWNKVAEEYNKGFEGTLQKAGSISIPRRRGQDEPVGRCLKEDRRAPKRSEKAIRGQIHYFSDPCAKKLIADAKKADHLAGDDEETDWDNSEDEENQLNTSKNQVQARTPSTICKGESKIMEDSEGEDEKNQLVHVKSQDEFMDSAF